MFKKIFIAALASSLLVLSSASFAEEKININTASVEQLQSLDGVGPITANAIVEYREANGSFASVEALASVSGIGEKKLEKLSNQLTVTSVD